MESVAQEFMSLMRHKVANMNPDHVLNMDQTPIPFSYHNKRTWEEKGVKTVHSQASTTDTKRATLAATVTMNGEVLLPLLIFKGSKNGRIEKMSCQLSLLYVLMPSKKRLGWTSP